MPVVGLFFSPGTARADMWLDRFQGSGTQTLDVVVPAGEIAPGPANARVVAGPEGLLRYRTRFRMPDAGPARIRLFHAPTGYSARSFVVEVRGERGGTTRVRATAQETGRVNPAALFVGDARGLEGAQRVLHSVRDWQGNDLGESARLVSRPAAGAMDCRVVAHVTVVIAEEPGAVLGRLRECAAYGAFVVVVAAAAPAEGMAPGVARVWGAGALGWARGFDQDLSRLAASGANNDGRTARVVAHVASLASQQVWQRAPRDAPRGIPKGVLFGLLGAYVLLLGPAGWLVLRQRRTVLSWAYFPVVALVATASIGIATLASESSADVLHVHRTMLLAPDRSGLELAAVRIEGMRARSYTVEAPWHDADLGAVIRPFRFGSPFAAPSGETVLFADEVRGRVRASGLTVARYSQAAMTWIQPTRADPPRLVSGPEGLFVTAPSDASRSDIVVVARDRAALLRGLDPGERRRVAFEGLDRLRSRLKEPAELLTALEYGASDQLGDASLVVSVSNRSSGTRARPAIPVVEHEVRIAVEELP